MFIQEALAGICPTANGIEIDQLIDLLVWLVTCREYRWDDLRTWG